MLGEISPLENLATKSPTFFGLTSWLCGIGNLVDSWICWMAKEGHLGSGRLRDLAWSENCDGEINTVTICKRGQVSNQELATHLVGVDPDKVDLSLVVTGDGLNALDESRSLRVIGWDEDVRKGNTSFSVEGEILR